MIKSIIITLLFIFGLNLQAQSLKSTRGLIAVIDLTTMTNKKGFQHFYNSSDEKAARRITEHYALENYDYHSFLYKENSTADLFLASIKEMADNPQIKTIDVIIYLHGHNYESAEKEPSLGFYSESHVYVPTRLLKEQVRSVANGKLRMLYSDACWGSLQNQDWLDAGFQAVAGSKKIDVNRTIDMKRFFKKWTKGYTYGESIVFANKNIISHALDGLVGTIKKGKSNSTKVPEGRLDLTIDDE